MGTGAASEAEIRGGSVAMKYILPSGRPFHCLNYSWLVGHFAKISMPAP